jgi:LemA protein
MIFLSVILGIILVCVLALVLFYNRLVRFRNRVGEAWSGIEAQLKRRANLIPNLVDTVKGYMGHERELLESIASLRSRSLKADNFEEKQNVEHALTTGLARLMAVAESYPDLKASQNFQDLQMQLTDTENQIQLARRYYNGTVRDLNNAVETFPSNLVAGRFGFQKAAFFEIEDASERAVPKVSF